MALTPVAVLMFRFNNPDALLVLLLTLAAYALTRAIEKAERAVAGARRRARRVRLPDQDAAGAARRPRVRAGLPGRRADDRCAGGVLHLLGAGLALLVSGGWWVAVVELVPAVVAALHRRLADQLRVGADLGLQRPRPADRRRDRQRRRAAAAGARPASAGSSPPTSAVRSPGCCPRRWSLGVAGPGRRRPRAAHRPRRAALLLWGGWLVVTGLVFSLMAGIFHAYYTVALAPAIAALVGIGGAAAVAAPRPRLGADRAGRDARRHRRCGPGCCSPGPPTYYPWLKWLVLVVGLVAAVGLLVADRVGRAVAATLVGGRRSWPRSAHRPRTPSTPRGRRTPARSRARARR